MLNFTRHGGTKRRGGTGAFPQQQAEGVRVVANEFHKGGNRGANDAAAFSDTLARLAHQLAQHEPAFIHHGQTQLIDVAKMTIEGRRGDPRFPRHFAQAQAGKTALSTQLTECRFHQRTPGFFFLLRSYAHHVV